jgi:chaperonin GroES
MSDVQKLKPLSDHVILRVFPEGRTPGGIILPTGVKMRNRAEVLAVNPGRVTDHGTVIPCRVSAGDIVLCRNDSAGMLLEKTPEGDEIVLVPEHFIVAIEEDFTT